MTYPLICPTMDAKKYPPIPDHLAGDTNKLTDYDSCVGQAGNPHPVAGQLRPDATVSRSSIVPLKFNFQMDGIGGIVIGNIFKVQASKLPIGYQADDIAFVVMGINHKISSGQDWLTEISGQLILLDSHYLGKDQTTANKYTLSDITNHIIGGRTFPKTAVIRHQTVDGVEYTNRHPNAARVVKYFYNDYDDPRLKNAVDVFDKEESPVNINVRPLGGQKWGSKV